MNRVSVFKKLGLVCASISCLVGIVIILGWLLDIPQLTQIDPKWPPMQFNTALLFLMAGAGILLMYFSAFAGNVLGVIVSLFSMCTFFEYLLQMNLGIDQVFYASHMISESLYPGRMSPNTAFCFILLGLSIVFIHTTEKKDTATHLRLFL